ncbi:Serine/threonine-protein kinase HRK1 [Nakaseomyces bracarensis]|uniref:non-specific serine/threonine protein kinase n=1 Tax=Nakaseomyces bracarensis TaxID=273131 RepID=A0ABR4NZE5_9SACH
MPSLLARNPFHHHHHDDHGSHGGSGSSLNDAHDNQSIISTAESISIAGAGAGESSVNTDGKRRKPFLNFMNVGNSNAVTNTSSNDSETQNSVLELKRFLRPSLLHNDSNRSGIFSSKKKEVKRPMSPNSPLSPTKHSNLHNDARADIHTQSAIPPSTDSVLSLANNMSIYQDDTILAQKYGKLGKTLGSGAGGSVKILKRPSDGATFAVKEFRPRKPNESSQAYAKKCIAEFTIGSTLHHVNVIETLDIFSDAKKQRYFEVMQYCPVDFFAVVMSGKMSRGEVYCCVKQLAEGVRYLHSMGLAHRDLKLDNCVMTDNGILKLIDFGSAVVFRYPFEKDVTMASGIVGSDPYLAPEVLGRVSHVEDNEDESLHQHIQIDKKTGLSLYDPQCVDVWSIGIIFCCMMLKRFPWKAPRESDPNFKLYNLPEDEEHDYDESAERHEKLMKERKERKHAKEVGEQTPAPMQEETPDDTSATAKKDEKETLKDNGKIKIDHEEVREDGEQKFEEDHEGNNDIASEKGHKKDDDDDSEKHHHKGNDDTEKHHSKKESSKDTTHSSGKRVIHGQYRLMRLLPHASRPIMSRMLAVNPNNRVKIEDVFNDEWFKDIPMCTVTNNEVVRAHGHHHTVVKDIDGQTEIYKV